ncbi:MAG: aminoglycoside phosphotransferase family protein [Oscillospiraceae bacterium]|nr:aminoglycoside phosphotransferase family protein [Oscillospiraceae bacterium]
MQKRNFNMDEIRESFQIEGEYAGFYPSNYGHINNTFIVNFEQKPGEAKSYVLQEINTSVFKDPVALMENIVNVTAYLSKIIAENGGDPQRETLNVFPAKDGKSFYLDADGRYWRLYNYISDSYTCQTVGDPRIFYNAAKAFGRFQCMLSDYPSHTLHETIPNFHHTPSRLNDLKTAVEMNLSGRAANVRREIEFALERESDAGMLVGLLEKGELPLRVTHNDTKLNNVMFDNGTDEGVCVIDLDTVMPGLSLYDFGDSIRFGAATAEEDEQDLSKMTMSLALYEQYAKGYIESAGKILTENEIKYLPFSAKLMTYECGTRFLTDYLNGDTYFRTAYGDHNLTRCRTQFKLVSDMEKMIDSMTEITERCVN